ncbi:ribonuclease H-like domain-containing protein [Tanacetum coccineum]
MRTKPRVDSLNFDDLYNNLRVFESDVKGSTVSSSGSQNVAFVSENTSSTNDVSTAYGVSNSSSHNSPHEQTSSYSLLANQSSCPQLDHEDLEQLDEFDLEEMDLKWQEPVGFDKTKVECYNCHKTRHFARECRTKGNQDSRRRDAWNSGKKEVSKALVTIDGEGVDWTSHSEEDEDYALMACNSSGSDTEVTSCSNECKESYAKLKKLYDAQREQLSDASIEIKAYTQGLKKVEAQLVAHQQGQLWYEQKIKFMKIDLDDKTDVLTYHKKLLAEAQKEKEDLKAKVEKWHNSSKNLGKLLNTQMSANDKFGLGYGDHRYDGILSYENEVLQSVFKGKESDFENPPLYDRFVTAGGMNVVPPPMTRNYMPSGPNIEVDYSQFTYGPKQTQPSESETQTSKFDTCESNISTVNLTFWSDAPIIEEYESDSEDVMVSLPTKEQETPKRVGVWIYCRACFGMQEVLIILSEIMISIENEDATKQAVLKIGIKGKFVKGDKANLEQCAKSESSKPIWKGPTWLFDLDYLTDSMNYHPVRLENQANKHAGPQEANQNAGTEDIIDAGDSEKEDESAQDYFVLPIWSSYPQLQGDLPYGKKAIGTKWVYRNKKDERRRIEALGSFSSLLPLNGLYSLSILNVKSASFMEKLMKKVYVSQPHGFLGHSKDLPSKWMQEKFLDSDYAGANLDRKSTIGEYVVAANCCGASFCRFKFKVR